MAHAKCSAAVRRNLLGTSLTAGLLLMPLAAPVTAVEVSTGQALEEEESAVSETVSGVVDDLEDAVDEVEDAVDEGEDVVEGAADTVESTVDEVLDDAEEPPPPPPTAPPPVDDDGGGDGGGDSGSEEAPGGGSQGGTSAGGDGVSAAGTVSPLPGDTGAPGSAAGGTTTNATGDDGTGGQARRSNSFTSGPALQALRQGYRSESSLNLRPAIPPVVSAPFAYETPLVADGVVAVPTVPSMGALENIFAPIATAGGGPLPAGVPGSLVAAAGSLLLLLCGAHVLHSTGRLRSHSR